jgi:hypothetical protein
MSFLFIYCWGWGMFGFRMFLVIGQLKWLIANKKRTKNSLENICVLGFILKLININHSKYPSFCKILNQKWWWTKLGIKIILKQWGETKCTPKCALKIFPKITHTQRASNDLWCRLLVGLRSKLQYSLGMGTPAPTG